MPTPRPILASSVERDLRAQAATLPGDAVLQVTAATLVALFDVVDTGRAAERIVASFNERRDELDRVLSREEAG